MLCGQRQHFIVSHFWRITLINAVLVLSNVTATTTHISNSNRQIFLCYMPFIILRFNT